MPIPDFQTIMLPFLKIAEDGEEHSIREAFEKLADYFKLSESEIREMLPSGKQELFDNRVGWTRTFLKKAGLINTTRRGYFCVTDRGQELLKQKPSKIDVKLLNQYPEFKELIQAIDNYIKINNENPKPFVWTKKVDTILEKMSRCKAVAGTLY